MAFRLIPIHLKDYELSEMCPGRGGIIMIRLYLPFRLRSVPCIFNKLSDDLEWILLDYCKVSFACHIFEDFHTIKPPATHLPLDSHCKTSLDNMLSIFKTVGIPRPTTKTQGPSQALELMGILLDTSKMQARLASDQPEVSIAWQQLYAFVVACEIWNNLLHAKRIRFYCDNEPVVSIINTNVQKYQQGWICYAT